ncbi:MAG: hypothetical protein HY760_02005, partial [Nitrospirae bacterium]|nr:hypothetical protein [Nitrospirota bacterium]
MIRRDLIFPILACSVWLLFSASARGEDPAKNPAAGLANSVVTLTVQDGL